MPMTRATWLKIQAKRRAGRVGIHAEGWVGMHADIIERMKAAKAEGRLCVSENYGRTNVPCEACGKTEVNTVFVSICDSKEDVEGDPASGEVYLFGTTCWKPVKAALGL